MLRSLRSLHNFFDRTALFVPQYIRKTFIQISVRRPAGRNRKIGANPHAPIFLQTNKTKKQQQHKNPCTPPSPSEAFIGILKPVEICVLHLAYLNSIRRNGGFSKKISCKVKLALALPHISGGLRFGFASPTFQPAVFQL